MDYDADGDLDVVTGSYTGQFYLFRRDDSGGFAQRELLTDEGGDMILMPFNEVYSVTIELVDMDADGDLDMVVGNRFGAVQVVDNVGTRSAPSWSKKRRVLTTKSGAKIEGSNAHHADWDQDGVRDLIVGSEHGDVRYYRNLGKDDAPSYADAEFLIRRRGYSPRQQEGETPEGPGSRLKVHVTDWNGDGCVDLLVGDVTWQQSTPNPLTASEQVEKDELEAEYAALRREPGAARGGNRAKVEERIAAMRDKLRPYQRTVSHTHGWVWLYLRKDEAAPDRRGR